MYCLQLHALGNGHDVGFFDTHILQQSSTDPFRTPLGHFETIWSEMLAH